MRTQKRKILDKDNEKINAGLGGWLILVAIVMIYDFLGNLGIFLYYLPTLQGWIAYSSDLLNIIFLIFFFFQVYLIYLFFTKNVKFPRYYTIFLIIRTIYTLFNQLSEFSSSDNPVYFHWNPTIWSIISSLILIIYMKNSKRVKATFINVSTKWQFKKHVS